MDEKKVKTQTIPIPAYGSEFINPTTGKSEGINKFDPNTGKALEPTTLSSTNIDDKNQKNKAEASSYTSPSSSLNNGMVMNPDSSYAEAPSKASQVTDEAGNTYWTYGGKNYALGASEGVSEDPYINSIYDQLKTLKSQMSATGAEQINSIQANFSSLQRQQQEYNKGAESGLYSMLLRGGSEQTASSSGIMLAQTSWGLKQIADLNAKEATAMISAKQAVQENNMKLLNSMLDIANEARKEKQTRAASLAETINEMKTTTMREGAISDLLSEGINDPTEIFSKLKEQGISATSKDIKEFLDNLSISGKADKVSNEWDQFQYFKKSGGLPEFITKLPTEAQQFSAYAQMAKGTKGSSVTGLPGSGGEGLYVGKGAKTSTDEQVIRMRLFAKLSTILNKGALSDTDRATINENISSLRTAGLSEQEIMSRLAGFPDDVKSPYNGAFIDAIAVNTETNESQQVAMAKTGQLLAAGNNLAAMNYVENTAMLNAQKQVGKDQYVSLSDVEYVHSKVGQIEKLLGEGWSDEVGAFTGSFSSWLSKKFGWGQAIQIQSKINSLTAELINKRAGSSITEAEWDRLIAGSVPAMNDSAKAFKNKMDELIQNPLDRLNSERMLVALPELPRSAVGNAQKRLDLYSSGTETADFWGPTGKMNITNSEGTYEIPD